MKCKKVLSCLNAYVDGEVSARLHHIMAAHLAACESCRGRLEEIRKIDELFQGALPIPPVPGRLAPRIMAEARKRQPARTHKGRLAHLAWTAFRWIAGLSAPMRLTACATVLLALVAGLSLDGRDVTRQNMLVEQGTDLYGLEWFSSVPPGSIGAVYIAMTDEDDRKGRGR